MANMLFEQRKCLKQSVWSRLGNNLLAAVWKSDLGVQMWVIWDQIIPLDVCVLGDSWI